MLLETNLIKRCLRGVRTGRSYQGTRRPRKRLESPSCARAQRQACFVCCYLYYKRKAHSFQNSTLSHWFCSSVDSSKFEMITWIFNRLSTGIRKDFVRTRTRGSILIQLSIFWLISLNTKLRLLEFSDRGRLDSTNRHAFHWNENTYSSSPERIGSL